MKFDNLKRVDVPPMTYWEDIQRKVYVEVASGIKENGCKWATIYTIVSAMPNKGNCQYVLTQLKEIYRDYDFGSTVALNDKMAYILKKLGIKEYKDL